MTKHDEIDKTNKDVVDYFVKLCSKKKIVWLNDLNRTNRKVTPDFVRFKYLGGQLKNVLNSDYALGNDLRCVTVELGEVKKKSMIVFSTKNEDYVKKCLKDFKKLKNELDAKQRAFDFEIDSLKRKMLKIGGRFD